MGLKEFGNELNFAKSQKKPKEDNKAPFTKNAVVFKKNR